MTHGLGIESLSPEPHILNMKPCSVFIFAVFFAVLITPLAAAQGNVYYVSQLESCNDDWEGNSTQPWCTLNKAAQTVQAGNTVLVRAGVYYETLTPVNSGSAGAMITFKAYDGEGCEGEYREPKTNCQVVISGLSGVGVDLSSSGGRKYIRVEGFEIKDSIDYGIYFQSYSSTGVEGIEIVGNHIHDNSETGIYMSRATNSLIENNEINDNGDAVGSGSGISVGGSTYAENVIFRGNNVYHNWDDAMKIKGVNLTIEDNSFHTYDSTSPKHADGFQIEHLINSIIRNNIMYDYTQLIFVKLQDNPGGYIENVDIYGNIFYTDEYWTGSGGEAPAIFFLGGWLSENGYIKNLNIHSNTFGWVGYPAIRISDQGDAPITDIDIHNNIFVDAGIDISFVDDVNQVTSNYNLFFNSPDNNVPGNDYQEATPWQDECTSGNSICGQDPQFIDYERHVSWDFHLKPTSPAIDAGDDLSAIFTLPSPFLDIDGTIRPQSLGYDIGAYEFVEAPEENCTDGIQNQDETGVDCGGSCTTGTETGQCDDTADNDHDCFIDCDDSDCSADPACISPSGGGAPGFELNIITLIITVILVSMILLIAPSRIEI